MAVRILVTLVLLFSLDSLSYADVRDDLRGINREIKEKRKLLNRSVTVETKVSSELEVIDKSLKEKQAQLKVLQNDLLKAQKGISSFQREIDSVQKDVDAKKELIQHRIRALYKSGDIGTVRMLFTAESFPQMAENMRYTQSVLAHDRKLVEEYQTRLAELSRMKKLLEADSYRLNHLKQGVADKSKEIAEEKNRKTVYLDKVREEKKGYQSSLRELQANARRLQSMIEKLEAQGRKRYSTKSGAKSKTDPGSGLVVLPDQGFGAQKGRLKLPAKGNITSTFGRHKHPEFNSFTINNGLTIAASAGDPIHAVFDGSVIFADYFKGYGNMMIIDHGGGYFSLYAHASRFSKKVGSQVSRNESVGTVGDLDSASGPKLYFEIRYQGKPVNPSFWVH